MKKIEGNPFVFVDAKLYFTRNGYTVYRVTVYLTSEVVLTSEITQGYDKHYQNTVGDMLFQTGYTQNKGYDGWNELKEQVHVYENSLYVSRKKDL